LAIWIVKFFRYPPPFCSRGIIPKDQDLIINFFPKQQHKIHLIQQY
jgi:hypothetical protein